MSNLTASFTKSVLNYFSSLFKDAALPSALQNLLKDTSAVPVKKALAKTHETLNRLFLQANTHDLTALPNHRFFQQAAALELGRFQNGTSKGMAVIMIDVDGLHALNRIHGRQAGNDALIACAKHLKNMIDRLDPDQNDVALHFSGDDFAVLVTDSPPEKAQNIFQSLSKSFPIYINLPNGRPHAVTAGMGIAVATKDNTLEAILNQADAALVEFKNARPAALQRPMETGPRRDP